MTYIQKDIWAFPFLSFCVPQIPSSSIWMKIFHLETIQLLRYPGIPSSIWMIFSHYKPSIEENPPISGNPSCDDLDRTRSAFRVHWGSNTFRTQRSVFGVPTAVLRILTSGSTIRCPWVGGQHRKSPMEKKKKKGATNQPNLAENWVFPEICSESPQPFTYLYYSLFLLFLLLLLSIHIFYNSQVFQFIWVNGWKSTIYGCFPQWKPAFSRVLVHLWFSESPIQGLLNVPWLGYIGHHQK